MRKLTILLGLSALTAMTTVAQAEDKKAAADEKKATKGGKGEAPIIGSDGVRRDPKGIARNEAWKKNQAESAEVKERIAKRLKEAEEASRKSASDPKNK